jgi:putative N-acetylmannosamine-6-phosphate epimerase
MDNEVINRLDEIIRLLGQLLNATTKEPNKARKFFNSVATAVTIAGAVAVIQQIIDWLK